MNTTYEIIIYDNFQCFSQKQSTLIFVLYKLFDDWPSKQVSKILDFFLCNFVFCSKRGLYSFILKLKKSFLKRLDILLLIFWYDMMIICKRTICLFSGFFAKLDMEQGPLSLHSSLNHLLAYTRKGLDYISQVSADTLLMP